MADSRKHLIENINSLNNKDLWDFAKFQNNKAKFICEKLAHLQLNLHEEITCLIDKSNRVKLTTNEESYLTDLQLKLVYFKHLEKNLQIARAKLENDFYLFANSTEQLNSLQIFIAKFKEIENQMKITLNGLHAKGAVIPALLKGPEPIHQNLSSNDTNARENVEAMVKEFNHFQANTNPTTNPEAKKPEKSAKTNTVQQVAHRIQNQFRLLGLTSQPISENPQHALERAQELQRIVRSLFTTPGCQPQSRY